MLTKIMKRILPVILTLAIAAGMIVAVPSSAAGYVSDYGTFVSELKVLETYADAFVRDVDPNKDPKMLVLNYIRTGVERYTQGLWNVLAGDEVTAFTSYVAEQDAANGTTVENLRDIRVSDFRLPNGNQVDFGHMFGTLNISYITSSIYTADLAGWSGDICDLISYSKKYGNVPAGTVDEMAAYVLEKCFGVDADNAFGMDDFYGDLDAFYLMSNYKGTTAKLSELMDAYFLESLSDVDRSAYFMNTRFKNMGLYTQADVRGAVLDAYMKNTGLSILETDEDYNIDRTADADLITACCYAFADYVYGQGGHLLNTGDPVVDPDDPDDPDDPGSGDDGGDEEEKIENPYFKVFSSTESILAPGITQKIEYAQTADKKQIVYYVATVDVNRDDVTIMANYRDNDPSKGWGMQRVEDQAKALLAKHTNPDDPDNYIENFNVIVATNADGYNMATGQPGGLLVMEGVEWHPVDGDGFFAILKDGTAMIGTKADYETYKDQIQEGIGGFGATLVIDGKININRTDNYYVTRASRTAIGITAEGKVVMMVLDGRQEPFSAGGSMEEIAQIMYEAGCVHAINLDGGGSTTYMSKPEGQDNLVLVNRPSDGYARSVSTSLVAISTAKSSKEFDHANISSEYEYITPDTSMTLTAKGVSNTGSAAVMPEGIYWAVSDESVGSITADGLFTALDLGTVKVQMKVGDTVVGEKTINVVVPDKLVFTKDILNATYGEPTKLPLEASYKGNLVMFKSSDIIADGNVVGAITSEGDVITAIEKSGVRAMRITAVLDKNYEVNCTIKANFYKPGESSFDFDNVTYGDRQFAWLRELSNVETFDDYTFYTVDTAEGHTLKYTFAIDMTEIKIPERLNDIIFMLPGADTGSTAWDYLLRLAERVSVLSEVRITAQFDSDLDVDISGLTVVNEYFYLREATLDENNKLTIVCGWVDQTAAIDPATANPLCILNGIVATPKADAGDTVGVICSGNISYNIFLRASSLYSFACSPTNQEKFGLIPFDNPDVIINGGTEKGASFSDVYATFNDSFNLVRTDRNGWYNFDSQLYYYIDNQPISAGVHRLPSFEDPSVKLYYEFGDRGALINAYTGFIGSGAELKYSLLGVLQTGWITVTEADGSESFYYFSPSDYNAVNGEQTVENGYKAYFVDYKCVRGQLVENETGLRYRFGGAFQRNQWIELDGKYYYFWQNYYAVTANSDPQRFWIRNIKGDIDQEYHIFDENGVWQKDMTGIYYDNGGLCYIRNGVRVQEAGIVYLGGNYYYFMSNTRPVLSGSYWPTVKMANGLVPGNRQYFFDEYGRMTNVPATAAGIPDGNEGKNGIYEESDGTLGYYINGAKRFNMGLVEIEDGVYIYVDRYGALAVGECLVDTDPLDKKHDMTNKLLPAGTYIFDENGKYIPTVVDPDEPEEPDIPVDPDNKNGIIEENGELYYYVDGALAEGAGLVEIKDGVFIYVRSDGRLAIGLYWPTITNGLLPLAKYDFGDNGRYTATGDEWGSEDDGTDTPVEPEVPDTTPKNGIVEENGVYYYYVDDVLAYGYGLVEIEDGVYIYVRSNGQLATGSYWPTNSFGLLPAGLYDFGEDGRYVAEDSESTTLKNGIVEENGTLCYYVNGKLAYGAGLVEIENGVFIYVRSNGSLATGKYWPTNSNGLLSPGVYDFGTDGKYVKG